MCCVKGKGHAVLPVCWLQPDDPPISEEDGEASKRENDVKVFTCCVVKCVCACACACVCVCVCVCVCMCTCTCILDPWLTSVCLNK